MIVWDSAGVKNVSGEPWSKSGKRRTEAGHPAYVSLHIFTKHYRFLDVHQSNSDPGL